MFHAVRSALWRDEQLHVLYCVYRIYLETCFCFS